MIAETLLPRPLYCRENPDVQYQCRGIGNPRDIADVLTGTEIQDHTGTFDSPNFVSQGYVIRTKGDMVLVYSSSEHGKFYGNNTARRIMRNRGNQVPDLLIVDRPAFSLRGVMEKAYGVPWTWKARTDIVGFCAQYGFNQFVLAPCDISQKVNWRDPFSDRYLKHLQDFVNHCHNQRVRLAFEFLPIGIDLGLDKDYQTLLKRSGDLLEIGVDDIIIAFDDVDDYSGKKERKQKAALRQINFLNRFFSESGLNPYSLAFNPVQYHGIKDSPYLQAIRENLISEIVVGWTGPKIRSETVTVQDADAFAKLIRRYPLLGHNFPVVDEMDKKRRVTVGPLIGLDKDLPSHLRGIVFNFMEIPYASLISGLTCADYAWNPTGYDPSRSIENSCAILGPNLMRLVEINPESYVNPDSAHPIASALKSKRLNYMSDSERSELGKIFKTMVELDELVSDGTLEEVYREIRPWLNQANIIGGFGTLLMNGGSKGLNWRSKGYAALKMSSGQRLGGLVFEDWVLREFGFPASLFYHIPSLRMVGDFFERVARKRHNRQNISQ
ncbi:MAG: beta-N-acetylglucosaminidase domain-containing protein [Candidatus Woesearchaeota archaeon]